MNACQNVCADFGWIVPLTEWLQNIAVVFGVVVAVFQLNAWRREHISKRRSEISEQLLSTAINVKLAISSVRSAMESIPADAENKQDAIVKVKWERLASYNGDFERLRHLQVLHEAFVGSELVRNAVDELFDVRQEIYAALATLSGWQLGLNPNQEHLQLKEKLTRQIYSMGPNRDELGPRVNAAVETLRAQLLPEIRMEQTY